MSSQAPASLNSWMLAGVTVLTRRSGTAAAAAAAGGLLRPGAPPPSRTRTLSAAVSGCASALGFPTEGQRQIPSQVVDRKREHRACMGDQAAH